MSINEFISEMLIYIMIGTFLENTLLSRALGSSTALWMIRKKYNIMMFGLVLTVIITLASIISSLLLPFVKLNEWSFILTPLLFIAIIGLLYITLILIANRLPEKYKGTILIFVHRCAFNGAVYGALLLGDRGNYTTPQFIGFGIGMGIGYTIASYIIYISYKKLNSTDIPKSFRGFPITLIYLGILSLAVYGLIGHELPI